MPSDFEYYVDAYDAGLSRTEGTETAVITIAAASGQAKVLVHLDLDGVVSRTAVHNQPIIVAVVRKPTSVTLGDLRSAAEWEDMREKKYILKRLLVHPDRGERVRHFFKVRLRNVLIQEGEHVQVLYDWFNTTTVALTDVGEAFMGSYSLRNA